MAVKVPSPGNSLVVQWLRLHAPSAGGLGLIPGQETRSRMLQLKILGATMIKDPVCEKASSGGGVYEGLPSKQPPEDMQGEARPPGKLVAVLCSVAGFLRALGQVTSPLWSSAFLSIE